MAENESVQKYAYLDQLSTEQLNELLRADIESPESGDEDVIFHILEVIERREAASPDGHLPDVDKAWEDFQTYYNTPEGEGLSLYPTGEQTGPEGQTPISSEPPKKRRLGRIVEAAVLAAVVAALFLPPAMGYGNVFQMLGEWSQSTFHFSPSDVPPESTGAASHTPGEYESLRDALEDYGVTENIVPTWFPDGFVLDGITVRDVSDIGKTEFHALYENGEKSITIMYTLYSMLESRTYEKDKTAVETYIAGGISHYIFENNGRIVSAWYDGNMECSIRGDITTNDMKNMIDSIYEG